jgi:hypothetical protein
MPDTTGHYVLVNGYAYASLVLAIFLCLGPLKCLSICPCLLTLSNFQVDITCTNAIGFLTGDSDMVQVDKWNEERENGNYAGRY